MFGREDLEFLELFPALTFAADLCTGFRYYRVVILCIVIQEGN